jgi:PAS domain S-box-containing protein
VETKSLVTGQFQIEQYANDIFEFSLDAMIITSVDRKTIALNSSFSELLGFSATELVGNSSSLWYGRTFTEEESLKIWDELYATGEWGGEIIVKNKDGYDKPFFLKCKLIRSDNGKAIGTLAILTDLSERKRLEEKIIEGEKYGNIGESLAALMHEIRNPINGISMNVYMLENSINGHGHWTEGESESVHLIGKEIKRLESLIKSALSYAARVEVREENIRIRSFFDELKELLDKKALEDGVELIFEIESEILSGRFDSHLMKQVFLNLGKNAIQAASKEKIRVVRISAKTGKGSSWKSVSASGTVLLLSVENSGEPIPDTIAKHLFKPFFTTKDRGLGLGLPTSAKIVREHHGIISHAHSTEPPYSTIFTIAVPK